MVADPRRPEVQGSMKGCGDIALFVVGLIVAALFVAGYIAITGLESFSDTMTTPQPPSAVK